jgi:hypothetical protein
VKKVGGFQSSLSCGEGKGVRSIIEKLNISIWYFFSYGYVHFILLVILLIGSLY